MQQRIFFETIELVLLTAFFLLSALLFSGVPIVSKLILINVIFIVLILNIYKYQKQKLNITFVPKDVLIFYIVFFSYLLLHTFLLSKNVYDSKIELTNFFIYTIVFFTILLVKKENLVKSLLCVFFIVNVIIFLTYISDSTDRQKMVYYFFYNPNIFAGFCSMNIFFSYDYIKENLEYKNIALINFVSSILLIVLLQSYSAIFVTIFLISILLRKYYNLSLLTIMVFTIFLLIVFSVINFQTFLDRVLWLFVGIKIFLKNIFFGVGLGNFKYFYLSNISNLFSSSVATTYVHNYFLQLSSEIGMVGIILFLIFISKVLSQSRTNKFFFYPLISILFLNFFDYNLYIPQNSILLFSMLAGYVKIQEYNLETSLMFKYTYFILVIFTFVAGIYIIKNFYEIEKFFKQPDKQNLKKIILIDNTCWEAYINLSKINFVEKKFSEAIENLNLAIKYNPQYSETYFYLALIYKVIKKDKNIAYKILSKAIKLNPKAGTRYIKYFKYADNK